MLARDALNTRAGARIGAGAGGRARPAFHATPGVIISRRIDAVCNLLGVLILLTMLAALLIANR